MRVSRTKLAAVIAVGALTLSGCAASGGAEAESGSESSAEVSRTLDSGPLRILLTNDDGWGADGIVATYEALTAAGHDVTVVAPSENNSGVSAAIDFSGELTVVQEEENIYTVSGTPVTSVFFGVEQVLGGELPDLIVSGSNVGANTGFGQNFSGTIGAAVVASGKYDVPAIAISTATKYGEEESAAYKQTADLLVDLLGTGKLDIRSGEILNINYPVLKDGDATPEVRVAPAASVSEAALSFKESGPNKWKIAAGRSTQEPEADSDVALLAEGFVTIDMLKVSRSVVGERKAELDSLAKALNEGK